MTQYSDLAGNWIHAYLAIGSQIRTFLFNRLASAGMASTYFESVTAENASRPILMATIQ